MIKTYKTIYLPVAINDLRGILDYITVNLKDPKAAMDLVDTIEKSISRLQQFPYSCRVYQTIHYTEYEYRMLPVKNYLVFYVVTEHEVEIHRIVYAKMVLGKLFQ